MTGYAILITPNLIKVHECGREEYYAEVPGSIALPSQGLKVYSCRRILLIHDAMPTFEELRTGKRKIEEIPKDAYINHCRVLGDIIKEGTPHVIPPSQDSEEQQALEDYVADSLMWLKLDGLWQPIFAAVPNKTKSLLRESDGL